MNTTLETLTTEMMAAIAAGDTKAIERLAAEINAIATPAPVVRNVWDVREGDMVSGTYHGVAFTGKVHDRRYHSINYNLLIVSVDLDTPITVWDANDTRTFVTVQVNSKGQGEYATLTA
jgi:hypothetical protein